MTEPSQRVTVQTLQVTLDTQAPSPDIFTCIDCEVHNGVYFSNDSRYEFTLEAMATDSLAGIREIQVSAYYLDPANQDDGYNLRDVLNAYSGGQRHSGTASTEETEILFDIPAAGNQTYQCRFKSKRDTLWESLCERSTYG